MAGDGDAIAAISAGAGDYNVRTVDVTQWIIDPTTGVGAWTQTAQQVLVLADKRGDLISNEDLLGEVVAELRTIRELLETLMLKLS